VFIILTDYLKPAVAVKLIIDYVNKDLSIKIAIISAECCKAEGIIGISWNNITV